MRDVVKINTEQEARDFAYNLIGYFVRNHNDPRPLEVTVDRWKPKKTRQQERALFGHAYKIIREARGHDVNDLHEYFCGEYFGWRDVPIGNGFQKPMRTTSRDEEGRSDPISTRDMMGLYDLVVQRAAMDGVVIPDPDPRWRTRQIEQIQQEESENATPD